MSILEKIRSKTTLLVSIVGIALLIFILQSLLGSSGMLFSGDDRTIGTINGTKIDILKFKQDYDNKVAQITKSNPNAVLSETDKQQLSDQIWNDIVFSQTLSKEFKNIGLTISADELYYNMLINPHRQVVQQLTDPQTGKVFPQIARQDGSLDLAKVTAFVKQVSGAEESFWIQLEKTVAENIITEKYTTLIKKGLYITKTELMDEYHNQNKKASAAFVFVKPSNINTSKTKTTNEEITAYYNANSALYTAKQTNAKIEYVSFDVLPSQSDLETISKDLKRVAGEMKNASIKEDSTIMNSENPDGQILLANVSKKFSPIMDSVIFTASKGDILGPITEGAFMKLYKVENIQTLADSVKVRHILIGFQSQKFKKNRTNEEARKTADSILTVLKTNKKVTFDSLVNALTDDEGSIPKKGVYDWFNETKNFVEPFKIYALEGKKGNIAIVKTQFGYHVIEIMDVSKNSHKSYQVAQVVKLIEPSAETVQDYYKKANDFLINAQTSEAFNNQVTKLNLTKRLALDIKETDRQVTNINNSKEIIKWVFKSKVGEVSPVIDLQNKFIVAHIVKLNKKGLIPMEDVQDDIKQKLVKLKAIDELEKELIAKTQNLNSLQDVATALSLKIDTAKKATFATYFLPKVGDDNTVIGMILNLKPNTFLKALKTSKGVYFVNTFADLSNEANIKLDEGMVKRNLQAQIDNKVNYELLQSVKENANIEDHRIRFDF